MGLPLAAERSSASQGRSPSRSDALDGLRGVAVVAVVAYHAGVDALPGGYVGVDVFFVLSGYLITSLVLGEWRTARARGGRVRLGRFLERRVRRIVPALVVVVAGVVTHAILAGGGVDIRGDAAATLTWVQNWHLALTDTSYFDAFGAASPLRHAWSLAVEAQWYVLWPPALLLLLHVHRGRTVPVAFVALVLAVVSALGMAMVFDPSSDPSRAYYGTDTRGHVLLVGAALALWIHRREPSGRDAVRPGALWSAAATVGALVLAVAGLQLPALDPRVYRGGLLLVALATAGVVGAALRAGSVTERVLAVRPLVGVGRVSYGLYLWHWPLYVWWGPSVMTTALAAGLAVVSYRYVETPIRTAPATRRRPALIVSVAGTAAVLVGLLALPEVHGPAREAAAARRPHVADAAGETPPPGTFNPVIGVPFTPPAGVTRIEVAGDSVAWTLAEHFPATGSGVTVDYRASFLGCGVVAGQPHNAGRPVLWADRACEQWEQRWESAIAEFRPDVFVVLLGAWEVLDHRTAAGLLEVGSPQYDAYVAGQLRRGIALVRAAGLPIVFLTAPCNDPDDTVAARQVSDRGDVRRIAWFNDILRREAASARDAGVGVIDLNGFACPGGRYVPERHGTAMRTDGMHFTPEGARLVWEWLLPLVTTRP